ncbi:MAG: Crp/Fnr family transcriptional regulator [Nitrospirae bacterium]|nr:Crp/Fnr family transcriptional regulator [Nitrospirota bacterium]
MKVYRINSEGKRIVFTIRYAGDYFGEMSLIDGLSPSAIVQAIKKTTVAIIDDKLFWTILHSDTVFRTSFIRGLCSRIRDTHELVERLTYNNAHHRVKLLFMNYFIKQNKGNDNNSIILTTQLTHQDIADMTGLIRETVSNVIIELTTSGEITKRKDKLYELHPLFFENI